MLTRDEIEGELRDVFANMSADELVRQLESQWRELVEEELERRRAENLAPAYAADDAIAIHAAQSPPSPFVANWRSRIARLLRSIFKNKAR